MTYPVREHADEQDGAIEGQIDTVRTVDAVAADGDGRWVLPADAVGPSRAANWDGRTPHSPLRRDARRPIATFSVVGGKPSIHSRLDDLPSGVPGLEGRTQ
jgi:hypothetical protein